MSEKPSPLLPDDEQSRDRLRAALVAFCVLAVVLAGTVVPAVSGAGLGQTPLGEAVPAPNVQMDGINSGSDGSGAGSAMGALNPGEKTGVGGSLAEGGNAFQSQNAEVHFTVQSSTASYWRTGAYDTYTGSGWKKSGDRRPYSGPVEGSGIQGRKVEYRVTLAQSATSLPSVWRANSVSAAGSGSLSDSLYVTDQRAFVTGDAVPAGTTYSGVSHRPARDPTVLRTAGRDYPREIESRYTSLPEGTDRRLGEFTSELTSGTDSPYETAKQVEAWLETNKNYSLNVSEPSGDDVASQFVFEMDKGYCEYFATSMVAMLRSQDIPARYVVGYSTGQQVGANAYKVRGMNAHAWVEVYFPDVGWVRFDPTPGRERLQAEQQAFENQTRNSGSDYDHSESGSPGEEFSPSDSGDDTATGETTTATTSGRGTGASGTQTDSGTPTDSGTQTDTRTTAGDTSDDGTSETVRTGETTTSDPGDGDESGGSNDSGGSESGDEYAVEINRTPVPGATVEVTVTTNGTPELGIIVFFNGERVGVTDTEGTVTGQVPYAETLEIRVEDRSKVGSVATPPTVPSATPPTAPSAASPTVPADFDAVLSLADPPPVLSATPPDSFSPDNETNGTEYTLSTNATLTVSGDVATGSEVVVTATVAGVPVRNADVTLDGETVGTTGKNGRVRVRLPESPGTVTLDVSRGPVSGEKTVTIPRLNVSVDPKLPVALPGTPVEVCATYGGDPLTDASVRVGDANRSTDINGSAVAALPFRGSATVVVSARGQTRRTTVSGLFVNLAGLLGGGAVVLGGLGFGAYRRGLGPRRLGALLLAAIRSLPDLAVALLFGAADRLSWAVETVLDALRELRDSETTVSELLDRFRTWLGDRLETVRADERWSFAGLGGGADPEAAGDDPSDDYRTLREAWDSFLRAVSVRRPDSMTPGELADHAVTEDDLPPGAVVTLRDAFRDVEYGARSPADRLPHVEDAIEAIERAEREMDADSGPAGGDD